MRPLSLASSTTFANLHSSSRDTPQIGPSLAHGQLRRIVARLSDPIHGFLASLASLYVVAEIIALEWRDIDLAARRLTVERSDWLGHVTAPKGGRSRQLPMTQRLTAALKAVRHLRGERVLCLPDGSPITRDRVIKAVRGAQRIAGIEQGVHILWHTFCSASAAASLRRDKSRCGYPPKTSLLAVRQQPTNRTSEASEPTRTAAFAPVALRRASP